MNQRAGDVVAAYPLFQAGGGGSTPTPALNDFWVTRIDKGQAEKLCELHPHAPSLPRTSLHCYKLLVNGEFAGLAAWGYGNCPRHTAKRLFGSATEIGRYLELNRFFVVDGSAQHTASKFLATTHRMLKADAPNVECLFTYAAGFQGLIGTIYQAAGYRFVGTKETDAFLWVPDIGLLHRISLWHAYGLGCSRSARWQEVYPGSRQWCGVNFEYVYQLRGRCPIPALPYPKKDQIRIWTIGPDGRRESMAPEVAKKVPIARLSYRDVRPLQIPSGKSTWRGRAPQSEDQGQLFGVT